MTEEDLALNQIEDTRIPAPLGDAQEHRCRGEAPGDIGAGLVASAQLGVGMW